jgi:hypothetical protein
METANLEVRQVNINQFEDVLSVVKPDFSPMDQSDRTLDNPAFYDFSFYEFLFPTETGGYLGTLSEKALATLDSVQAIILPELAAGGWDPTSLLLDILIRVEQTVRETIRQMKRRDWDEQQVIQDILDEFYRLRDRVLPEILQAYAHYYNIGRHFFDFLERKITVYLRTYLYTHWYPEFRGLWDLWPLDFHNSYDQWVDDINYKAYDEDCSILEGWYEENITKIRPDEYPFEVFQADSVNLGLRLVYRQEWQHLGTQPGEIVRTIPLGPGQTERITTKIVRRRKRTTNLVL